MSEDLTTIPKHMRELGLGALAHANWHANYMGFFNDKWPELSVLQAAHAAELLIKARIAEEHHLLVVEDFPRSTQVGESFLELKHLIEHAKTVQYSDLPERLWVTTGIKLDNLELYLSFGRLRNTIQHFIPDSSIDFGQLTAEFVFRVIDPFIQRCWNLYAIDYNEDDPRYVYLIQNLVRGGIEFLVSPDSLEELRDIEFEWPTDSDVYQIEMKNRFALAEKKTRE